MAVNPTRSSRVRTVTASFTCKHCHKVMVKEAAFLTHKCKEMKRFEELQSPMGQAALSYYQRWMRVMKRSPPSANAFLDSRYFRTFINFAQFAAKVNLPMPEKFIWLMVEKKYPPTMWTTDDAYLLYMEFVDHQAKPMDQVSLSVKTLLNIADEADVDVSDVFDHITPAQLIHLVRIRQLSPWLLLHSTKFKLYFRDKLSDEQKIILETLIDPDSWFDRFDQKPKDVDKIKLYIKELNI